MGACGKPTRQGLVVLPKRPHTDPMASFTDLFWLMALAAGIASWYRLTRAREVVAVEILCACQAIDLLAPLMTSAALGAVHACIRSRVPTLDDDRAPAPDIVAITELIATDALEDACGGVVK